MNRYAQAKAELERALVPERRRLGVAEPVRYASISVMQPWAWLIANASSWPGHVQGKTIENRSQPTGYRGPVLIHVSRKWDRVGEQLIELRRLGLVGRGCPEPNLGVMRSQLGMVIAVGQLVGCRRIGSSDPHPWSIAGAWGWELADIELVQPFGLRGHGGLWFAPLGVSVRRTSPKLDLSGLPVPHGPRHKDLREDTETGTTAIEVSSYAETVRALLRTGVRRFDHIVLVNGTPTRAGELLAKAAAEHGDADASRRISSWMPPELVGSVPPELATRGPHLHACERGRHV